MEKSGGRNNPKSFHVSYSVRSFSFLSCQCLVMPMFKAGSLANAPTSDPIIYHLEQKLTTSCICHLPSGLAETEIPVEQIAEADM